MSKKKKLIYELLEIPIAQIEFNRGQVEGLPSNPRFINEENYKKLKKSLDDDPEMLQLREPILYMRSNKALICIAGEQRLRSEKEKGTKTILCKVLPPETLPEKLRAYAAKDNKHQGQWDTEILANEWDPVETDEWIGNVPDWGAADEEEETGSSGSDGDKEPDFTIKLDYTEDEYRDVKEAFKIIGGTPEKIVYDFLVEKGLIKPEF